jgi:hypothetical protein
MLARFTLPAAFIATLAAAIALAAQPQASRPINDKCPISGRAVAPAITAVHLEETVAFCCAGCRSTFAKWDDEKKFDYIATQAVQRAERDLAPPPLLSRDWPSDLYTLNDCPITLGKLGSMGDPSVHMVDGREVRFCCPPCLPRFERQKDRWAAIDQRMIEQQLPHYPIETCIVTQKPLSAQSVSRIHKNRLVRFTDGRAAREFEKSPKPFLAQLDDAIIASQRATYPLETCLVTGRALGTGARPGTGIVEVIVANRLFRLADAQAAETLKADPAAHLATLDAARAANR